MEKKSNQFITFTDEERLQYKPLHQVDGTHYEDMAIQPIDIIRANNLNWFEGEALKYLLRYKRKNGVTDLLKCKHIIDMIIENYEGSQG